MSKRIDALVIADMSAEKAAEVIGCPLSALVQYGNGYAIVNESAPHKPKPSVKKAAKVTPEADEQEGE